MATSLEMMDHSAQPQVNVTASQIVRCTRWCEVDNTTAVFNACRSFVNPFSLSGNGIVSKQRTSGETTLCVYPFAELGRDGSNGTGDQAKLYILLWYKVRRDLDTQQSADGVKSTSITGSDGADSAIPDGWIAVCHEYNLQITANGCLFGLIAEDVGFAGSGGDINQCTVTEVAPPPAGSGEVFSASARGSSVIRVDLHGATAYSIIPSCADNAGGQTNNTSAVGFCFGCE